MAYHVVRLLLAGLFTLLFVVALLNGLDRWPDVAWAQAIGCAAIAGLLLARSWMGIAAYLLTIVLSFDRLMLLLYAMQPSGEETFLLFSLGLAPLALMAWLWGRGALPNPRIWRRGTDL